MLRLFQSLIISLWLCSLGLVQELQASEIPGKPIVLGVHPYLPFRELQTRYRPLADYLQRVLGKTVVVRVGRDYSEHIAYIGKDKLDIAFVGPATYVRMVQKYGKKPLLARLEINGKPFFHGFLVTSSNSGVTDIPSLRGKRFAFGDPESTMSHLVPRYMLLKAGVDVADLLDYQFLGSHKNVAMGVLSEAFDAGAVKEEVMEAYRDQGLRPFAMSEPYSEHLFVARGNADPKFVKTLRQALYRLSDLPEGPRIMNSIKSGVTGLVPVKDSDYDNIRTILKSLSEHGVD